MSETRRGNGEQGMRQLALMATVLIVCGLGAVGCDKKEETPSTPTPTSTTAPAVDKMSPGGDKMAAADPVKDKVDAALKGDDKLKSENISVEHKDGKVMLKGEVANTAAKKQANDVAAKAIKDAASADKLQNMLTVKSH